METVSILFHAPFILIYHIHLIVVHKGCAVDCIEANQNGKICETCDGDACNSEQSLAPMSGHDECRIPAHESRKSARSFPADIGSGTGYNGYNNNPDIGSGTGYNGGGYNPNNIGSGTGYNPNGIGSGVGYNPNSDNYPKQNSGGIGSGTVYGGNQPNGNYYPSGNVGSPYGGYGDRGAPQIGQGARPGGYNGVSTVMNLNKALGIMMSFIVVYFTL